MNHDELKKLAQIVNFLLKLNNGKQNYLWLIKVIYCADRFALKNWETTLTSDSYYNMKDGIVLSHLCDLLRQTGAISQKEMDFWNKYFEKDSYDVVLRRKDDLSEDELSKREKKLLTELNDKFKKKDWKAMRDYTHKFPEYEDPQKQGQKVLHLHKRTILKHLGWSDDQIREFEKENLIYKKEEHVLLND